MDSKNPWKILILLALIGVVSMFIAGDFIGVAILMVLAYFQNAAYSMVSRSAVRDSALYHGFTTLLSSFIFYLVIQRLVTENMTLALLVPYTVATVYGSFTGAKTSQRIEEFFGITTDPSKKKATPQSVRAQKLLVIYLGILAIIVGIYSKDIIITITIAALAFGDNVTFSILRRSRNTSNTTYHVIASLVKSFAWYVLFRFLALKGMPFELFIPYCFGSILGGITGQEISAWIERKISASADAHLGMDLPWYKFIPWKSVVFFTILVIPTIFLFGDSKFLATLAFLSAAQQISFSIVSRSRQRNNMAYHVIASVFSNGVWFLTFRQLEVKQWTNELFTPYALGGTIGSVTGVGISMGIEKKLNIVSDAKPAPKPV